jgi:archaellum component FlaC
MALEHPRVPLRSFGIVTDEINRLAQRAPNVVRQLADEVRAKSEPVMGWWAGDVDGVGDLDEQIEELEEEIEALEARLDRLRVRRGTFRVTAEVKEQAGIVHALLLQYEGIDSEVLSSVMQIEAM